MIDGVANRYEESSIEKYLLNVADAVYIIVSLCEIALRVSDQKQFCNMLTIKTFEYGFSVLLVNRWSNAGLCISGEK
jgi:hypothetical protein